MPAPQHPDLLAERQRATFPVRELTYLLDGGPSAGDWATVVLRRQPPGDLLPSAHDVKREFRVLKALEHTAVPVPRALALCVRRPRAYRMYVRSAPAAARGGWRAGAVAPACASRGGIVRE